MSEALPIRRRFTLLGTLSVAGAVAFVPLLSASAPSPPPAGLVAFVVVSSTISLIAGWLGLRWADQADLPMPLLRGFETGALVAPTRASLARAAAIGLAIGAMGIVAFRLARAPSGGGTLAARLASALFAAVTLELVLHLAVMSGVVRLTRGRVGTGILAAAAAYLAFHLSTLGGQPAGVIAAAIVGNGLAGLLFGWLYARDGFEYLIVAHLIAHATAVGFG